MKKLLLTLLCLSALVLAACQMPPKPQPLLGDVHEHADFKVYINGQALDFTQEKYMSSKEKVVNNFMHLHDMEGEMVHQHMSSTTLTDFFASLNMKLSHSCFVTDDGTSYCNEGDKTLKMYVNGVKNEQFGDYDLNDLDRILITYGSENEAAIKQQIDSVSDKACIQSLKCPERGQPSDESSCLSGSDCILATGVKETTQEATQVTTQQDEHAKLPAEHEHRKMFLVAPETKSLGKVIGCGDTLIGIDIEVTEWDNPKEALDQLFAIKVQNDGPSGLYNALYQSDLKVESSGINDDGWYLNLSGTYQLGGVCDIPRFEEQIRETFLQFVDDKRLKVFINGKPMEEVLSLKGE